MSPIRPNSINVRHPEPKPTAHFPVRPVFLPFAGCPYRCIYCAQDVQTGVQSGAVAPDDLKCILDREFHARRKPFELAFYGGTFTALPEDSMRAYLELAATLKNAGAVARIRCSTRPDCLSPNTLDLLARYGVDMVEVGVQSFDDDVLAAAGRGYRGKTARRGCEAVHAAGLELGIQLLPGLPAMTPDIFKRDISATTALSPAVARLYPLLVLEHTPLATRWRTGAYAPWTVGATVDALADALLALWKSGARVIRTGLAPEADLDAAYLAGPRHPALGQRARSLALLRLLKPALTSIPGPVRLEYPRRFQGELWGHGGELATVYAGLGLHRENSAPHAPPWEENRFVVSPLQDSAPIR